MKNAASFGLVTAACVVAGLAGMASAGGSTGPDVIVGDLPSVIHYGAVGSKRAYAVGTTSCNVGDANLLWIANNNQHPVIGQNLYRVLVDDRIDNIGISWLKHGFTALAQNLCGTCQNPGTGSRLGVNCSDPYGASLNGNQGGLGNRFQVNAFTGFFNYPWSNPAGSTGNAIFKRCQVEQADLTTAANAIYFFEGHYVTPDDAAAGNGGNNASYRRFRLNADFTFTAQGTTQREKPGIQAWADHGLGINIPDPDVTITTHFAPADGRFFLGQKVKDNGDGTWTYTYAIQNLDSHLSGQALTVPLGNGTTASDNYFNAPLYHSGEPYDNTPWGFANNGSNIVWSSPQTFTQNQNSNALRWGTMYNYWFTADTAPTTGTVTLGLFKPGTPTEVAFDVLIPSAGTGCQADFDGNTVLNVADIFAFLAAWFASDPSADIDGVPGIGVPDIFSFLSLWFAGCP